MHANRNVWRNMPIYPSATKMPIPRIYNFDSVSIQMRTHADAHQVNVKVIVIFQPVRLPIGFSDSVMCARSHGR